MTIRMLAAVLFPVIMLAAGGQSAARKPAKPAQTKTSAAQQTVPAGAEKVDANTWRYKDAAGKTWIYRQTPFGLARLEEKAEPAPAGTQAGYRQTPFGLARVEEKAEKEEPLPPGMKAFEDGDNVRFERPGPFGVMKWERPKSALTDLERRVWERDCVKKAGDTGEAKPSETGQATGK